jgi:hypothetical protein
MWTPFVAPGKSAGTAAATDGTGAAISSAPGKLSGTATATDGTGAAVSSAPGKSAGMAAATDGTGAVISPAPGKLAGAAAATDGTGAAVLSGRGNQLEWPLQLMGQEQPYCQDKENQGDHQEWKPDGKGGDRKDQGGSQQERKQVSSVYDA